MKRRSFCNFQRARTTDLLIRTIPYLANSQCFPCNFTMALHQKWNPQCKLPSTSPRTPWRRRGLQGRINNQTQKTRPWISISSEVERLSSYRCNMGIRIGIFRWWQYADSIQRSTPTLKISINKKESECLTHILTTFFHLKHIKNGLMPIGKVWSIMSAGFKLHWVILRCIPPPIQQHVGLLVGNLYPAGKWHKTQTLGYKTGVTLWRGIINSPLTPVTWPNKTLPSKPSNQPLTSIYLLILSPFIPFLSIESLPYSTFSLLTKPLPMTSSF